MYVITEVLYNYVALFLCSLSDRFLSEMYDARGHVKYLDVDFAAAIEDHTEAIKYNCNSALPYYNRGLIYYRMGVYVFISRTISIVLLIGYKRVYLPLYIVANTPLCTYYIYNQIDELSRKKCML